MSNHITNVNFVLLRSIPIDKNLKRYYLSKYHHLVKHNGLHYANNKFKELLTSLKSAKSGRATSPGIRQNGWYRKLYAYSLTQPHYAFSFVKGIYSWKGHVNKIEASKLFSESLDSVNSKKAVPRFLKVWNVLLFSDQHYLVDYYNDHRYTGLFSAYCKHHSLSEWLLYWKLMKKQFVGRGYSPSSDQPIIPFPEVYKDADGSDSKAFQRDLAMASSMLSSRTNIPMNVTSFLLSLLDKDLADSLKEGPVGWGHPMQLISSASSDAVGEIHFINKNGNDFRAIAVPNRIFQLGLTPISDRLYSVLHRIKRDASYRQTRFDNEIQSRLNSTGFFCGSVDLSAASDNLPLTWFNDYLSKLRDLTSEERRSWETFLWMCTSNWTLPNKKQVNWRGKGQPLGTKPSFAILGITHNLFLESLSLANGYGHSPYCVLGDDVIIKSKRLYNSYIKEMTHRNMPLSLNKSFFGNLTEFAGKVYCKNMFPFFLPDHSIVTWPSLFDWQNASGIKIPWRHLPLPIRRRINKLAKKYGMSGVRLYEQAQKCRVHHRGSSHINYSDVDKTLLIKFFELETKKDPVYHDYESLGILLSYQTLFRVYSQSLSVNGWFKRYRKSSVPSWFLQKFRRVSTDDVLDTTARAIRELEVVT